MTKDDTQLDGDLVWRDDGCLAEPAMHAVADAELELLPPGALEHAEDCSWCSERIGRIAMLSLEIDDALAREHLAQAQLAVMPLTAAMRRKLPVVPIALALLTALTCKLPLLTTLNPAELGHSAATLVHILMPLTLKLIHQLAHSPLGSALVFCSAAFLLAGSALLARLASGPSRAISNGGKP
jgi:hypothetical protein